MALRFIVISLTIGIVLFTHLPAYTQARISIGLMYNVFNLKSLKNGQSAIIKELPFDAKVVENFPGYLGYKLTSHIPINNHLSLGAIAMFTSTGGRISYADYSGNYQLDQSLYFGSFGPSLEGYAANGKNNETLEFHYGVNVTIDIVNYKFYSLLNLPPDISESSSANLTSVGMSVWPFMGPIFPITKVLLININAGYQLNVIRGKMKYFGSVVGAGPNWSGFRLEVSIVYNFEK